VQKYAGQAGKQYCHVAFDVSKQAKTSCSVKSPMPGVAAFAASDFYNAGLQINQLCVSICIYSTVQVIDVVKPSDCNCPSLQGGHRALKVLEKIVHFSRTWKVLENSVGP